MIEENHPAPKTLAPAAPPSLHKYRAHIAHMNLPEARADELLRAIWGVMHNALDRAFGEDAAQLCRKPAAVDEDKLAHGADDLPVIECAYTITTTPIETSAAIGQRSGDPISHESQRPDQSRYLLPRL